MGECAAEEVQDHLRQLQQYQSYAPTMPGAEAVDLYSADHLNAPIVYSNEQSRAEAFR